VSIVRRSAFLPAPKTKRGAPKTREERRAKWLSELSILRLVDVLADEGLQSDQGSKFLAALTLHSASVTSKSG
jgi:hypothetical protein